MMCIDTESMGLFLSQFFDRIEIWMTGNILNIYTQGGDLMRYVVGTNGWCYIETIGSVM